MVGYLEVRIEGILMKRKDFGIFKIQPINLASIIMDERDKRYMHIYRLVDEILEAEEISEELLEKIVVLLGRKWMWNHQADRRESRYLGKN